MRIGIKIGPHSKTDYVNQIVKYADYVEIYAEISEDWDYQSISNLGIPVLSVHVSHFDSGVNFADVLRNNLNIKALNKALEIADYFNSGKVIFHPELIDEKSGSIEDLIIFLKSNFDPRLLVENMPFSTDDQIHLCGSFEETSDVITKSGVGFCLDFTHAYEYAKRTGINANEMILKLISLQPSHFHLADTDLSLVFNKAYNETHLNLWSGNLEIEFIKSILPINADVTIETPQFVNKQISEIKFLKA